MGTLVLWTILTLLSATVVATVLTASRSRLEEALGRLDRAGRLALFDAHDREYAAVFAAGQFAGAAGFVVSLMTRIPEESVTTRRVVEIVVLTAAWLSVFGAAIPFAWARFAGVRFLARVLPLLELARLAAFPLLFLLRLTDELVRRLAGVSKEQPDESDDVEREILDALAHGQSAGELGPDEKAIIRSAMMLDETSVGAVMTPRTDIFALDVDLSYEDVRRAVITAGHSRVPVYEGDLDHVVGILYAKDMLGAERPDGFAVRDLMRQAHFIPETKDLASSLRFFQANRIHIAIVSDEYGGTAGLVTIEDILEELVGEIADEHDEPPPSPIRRLDENTADVAARVRIEEVNEALGIRLPEDEAYDTVAGFVLARLGRIPRAGETLTEDNVRLEVLDARDRAISRLRVTIMSERSED